MTGKPPTQEAFNKLLAWLDADREQAGRKYQQIQLRLIGIFSSHGCIEPEKLADETIDRVTAKINWLEENYVGEPTRYFCGVARNVLKEDLRGRVAPRMPFQHERDLDEIVQQKYDCLDRCMSELPTRNQLLVLAYYEEEGHAKIVSRKKLAADYGLTMKALRLRVFHIRVRLSECLKTCLSESSAG